jgi:hypothetical protein
MRIVDEGENSRHENLKALVEGSDLGETTDQDIKSLTDSIDLVDD